jgi:eukaryotic-like serine/threonine-protein kinase
MLESSSGSDLLNELAHEFSERYRHGERPSLNEYTDRYPGLAIEIRELFPALVMMEQFGSDAENASGPAAHRPRHDEPIPENLGDYRIVREIGRGGMGIVYEAVQESLGRRVALKVLSQNRLMGPVQLQRFEREAKSAALLHHTNIVPVFGVGEHEGVHYYAMQYIEGQSLDTVFGEIVRLRGRYVKDADVSPGKPGGLAAGLLSHRLLELRTPVELRRSWASWGAPLAELAGGSRVASDPSKPALDLSASTTTMLGDSESHYFRSVARLGMQAAEALAYAHQHGLLHRDIKPANLLLDLRGTLWITDFGLAKAEGSDELTSPGDVVGTLRYMAPERFHGKADPRSDIYSLGLTLYEMLTFAPAFTASHRVEYIHAILHEEPERLRKRDRRIPLDLETIVLKSISKNPLDRYRAADDMARELGRFVEGRPILSRRVALLERAWRWSRRNRMTAALILLAASLTTILAIGSTLAAWEFRDQRNAVQAEEKKTRDNLNRALLAEREREAELGRSLLVQARAVRYSGQPGRRSHALESLGRAARIAHAVKSDPTHLAELRDEVIAALALFDNVETRRWSGVPADDDYTSFRVEADRYVRVDARGLIHVVRLSDGFELRVVGAKRPARRAWPRLLWGGRFVSTLADYSRYELWDIEKGDVSDAWPADTRCTAAGLDGRYVAALRSTGELLIFDLRSFTLRSTCQIGFPVPRWLSQGWLCVSQDGRRAAVVGPDEHRVSVHDVDRGRMVHEIKVPLARVDLALALNRSGGLLSIAHDRAISVYDMADGEQLSRLQGHQSEGVIAHFQPNGDLLASSAWDGTTRLWDPIRGGLILTLTGGLRQWVQGESGVVIGRGHDMIEYQVAVGVERRSIDYRMLGDQAGAALYGPARVSFSPDGQLLAMATRPEGVRIARLSDGAALAFLPIGACDEVLFMPGGDLLTFNNRGLCRWAVSEVRDGGLQIGPPIPLAQLTPFPRVVQTGLATSADGRILGVASFSQQGSMLLDRDRPWRRTALVPHKGVFDLAISPDGRWACSASSSESAEGRKVKVWDVSTGDVVVEWLLTAARVAFSPDSRWLGIGAEGHCRFFRTGRWKPGPEVEFAEGPLAFHPGGRLAAFLDGTRALVRIAEVESGKILAVLESPGLSLIYCLEFSPDGRFLAVSRSDQRVDLWDLKLIQHRLASLSLGGDLPTVFEGATQSTVPIDRIEVHGAGPAGLRALAARHTVTTAVYNFLLFLEPNLSDPEELVQRGSRWLRLGHWKQAVADFRASLKRRGDSAYTANELAWALVSIPGRGNTAEALAWARKAVEMVPESGDYHNTLGVALYRAGRFSEAAEELERNSPRNKKDVGFDLVFLSMCRQRLGQTAKARNALEQARQWQAGVARMTPSQAAQFEQFVSEAELVLTGILPDLPSDVFAR